jgi:hypothetical protein
LEVIQEIQETQSSGVTQRHSDAVCLSSRDVNTKLSVCLFWGRIKENENVRS